ncbi:MAG: glycosyltransferase [Planctomycetes bacterium]|nr:glycosyltransferase [Planctomycetota bacterium]
MSTAATHNDLAPAPAARAVSPGLGFSCVHYLPSIALHEGGLVRAVFDLCRVLASRGMDVTLLTYDTRDAPKAWLDGEPGTPRVVKMPGPILPRQILGSRSMKIAAEWIEKTDVVHLHGPFILSSVQMAKLARRMKKPYVFTAHGMLDDWSMARRPLLKRLFMAMGVRRALRRASRVHCTADKELEQAQKWFGEGWGIVLPYVVDTQPYENLPGPEAAKAKFPDLRRPEKKVLFLGRLHPKKGVDILLRAAASPRSGYEPFRVVIAGPSEPEYLDGLRRLAGTLGVLERVDFLGMVGGDLKLSLMQSVDVMALPTWQENFGLVLVESMACGTPVVTTWGVDIWPEIEQAGGLICDRSSEAFAMAFRDVLANPVQLRHRGQMGRQWVMETLNPTLVVQGYEAMYREVSKFR